MSNWKEQTIQLGKIPEKSTHVVTFQFIGECEPEQVRLQKSCGCTFVSWDKKNKEVNVTYSAGKIPPQVVDNKQIVKKLIKMKYICNKEEFEDNLNILGVIAK